MTDIPTPAATPAPSGVELKSLDWFPAAPVSHSLLGVVLRSAIGLVIGLLVLLVFHHLLLGSVIIVITLLVGGLSLVSGRARGAIARGLAAFGKWVGAAISWILLTPIFLIGFTLVRGWMWLTGADPLQMKRRPGDATYWLQSDDHRRKLRYAGAMFASERIQRRGLGLAAVLALLVATLVISEGFLRWWGYGDPILYAEDAQIGYYPAPNQTSSRAGGLVHINAFGMRSPDYAAVKAPGTFRILMIGDSTLYGGSYIDQEGLYSRQLETALRQLAPGRRVEVMAMSANAWGPLHELGYIRRFGTFGADLVIVCLPTVDIYRPLTRLAELPFPGTSSPPRFALQEVAMHLMWRARTDGLAPPSDADNAFRRREGMEAYRTLAQMLRASGAEVQFHVLPTEVAGTVGITRDSPAAVANEQRDARDLAAVVAPFATTDFPAGLFRGRHGALYHDGAHLDVDGHNYYAAYLRDYVVGHSSAWRTWNGVRSTRP